jgi:hypothetical protein
MCGSGQQLPRHLFRRRALELHGALQHELQDLHERRAIGAERPARRTSARAGRHAAAGCKFEQRTELVALAEKDGNPACDRRGAGPLAFRGSIRTSLGAGPSARTASASIAAGRPVASSHHPMPNTLQQLPVDLFRHREPKLPGALQNRIQQLSERCRKSHSMSGPPAMRAPLSTGLLDKIGIGRMQCGSF